MVVLNQLVSHSFVLHHSFMGLLLDFDNDLPAGGRENGEIVRNKLPQIRVSCDS